MTLLRTSTSATLAAGIALAPTAAQAHDPDLDPGPSQLVQAFVGNTTAPDDEAGDDELGMLVEFDHDTHGKKVITAHGVGSGARNFPFGDPEVFANGMTGTYEAWSEQDQPGFRNAMHLRYQHPDCSPRNDLIVRIQLVEIDVDPAGDMMMDGITSIPGVSDVLGVGWFVAGLLRGNEDYGSDMAVVPATGIANLTLDGVHGRTTIPVTGKTIAHNGTCPSAPPVADPERRTGMLFDLLNRAHEAALVALVVEDGHADPLTAADREAATTAAIARVIGTARLATAREIGSLSGPEIAEAVGLYQSALERASIGDVSGALDDLEAAYFIAASLRDGGSYTEIGNALPTAVLLPSEQLHASTGQTFELRGQVVGLQPGEFVAGVSATGDLAMSVLPGHDRMAVALTADLGDHPVHRVLGLDRFTGASVAAPTATCDRPHLIADAGGAALDGVAVVATDACGFGRVVTTRMQVLGGTPVDAAIVDGTFGVELALGGAPAGVYPVDLVATIAGLDGERTVTTRAIVHISEPSAGDGGGEVEDPADQPGDDDADEPGCGGCQSSGGPDGGALLLLAAAALLATRRRRRA